MRGIQSLQKKISNKFYLFIKECNADLITKIAPGTLRKPTQRKIDSDIDSKNVIKSMICAVGFTR